MMMPEEVVMSLDPGVCRFRAKITAEDRGEFIHIKIKSDCPHAKDLEKKLDKVDAFDALKMPFSENVVYKSAGETLKHSACPIPSAVIKCIEAASGLALKKNVVFEYES